MFLTYNCVILSNPIMQIVFSFGTICKYLEYIMNSYISIKAVVFPILLS